MHGPSWPNLRAHPTTHTHIPRVSDREDDYARHYHLTLPLPLPPEPDWTSNHCAYQTASTRQRQILLTPTHDISSLNKGNPASSPSLRGGALRLCLSLFTSDAAPPRAVASREGVPRGRPRLQLTTITSDPNARELVRRPALAAPVASLYRYVAHAQPPHDHRGAAQGVAGDMLHANRTGSFHACRARRLRERRRGRETSLNRLAASHIGLAGRVFMHRAGDAGRFRGVGRFWVAGDAIWKSRRQTGHLVGAPKSGLGQHLLFLHHPWASRRYSLVVILFDEGPPSVDCVCGSSVRLSVPSCEARGFILEARDHNRVSYQLMGHPSRGK